MSSCRPCAIEFSRGNGTGTAEALSNWAFCSEVTSPGHELSRIQCLLERMESLREPTKCNTPKSKECDICVFEHNSPNRRPCWMFPKKRPYITYTSIDNAIKTSNKKLAIMDALNPIPERRYCVQGNDKWYKLGPLCCPQPSCPAPYCPKYAEIVYCCHDRCS